MAATSQVSTAAGETVPKFVPHRWLRNGHLQTIVGRYLSCRRVRLPSLYHEVDVGNGDRVAVLESVPKGWQPGEPMALIVHGLAGSARSPYVVRLGHRLRQLGVAVVRMNLRGAGTGFGLARGTYHAGLTDDLRRVVEWMERRHPGSPTALVGFSLGANLVLKLAAEASVTPLDSVDCVLAANPPIDLAECCRQIQRPANRVYDRSFVKQLRRDVVRLHCLFPELGSANLPKSLSLFGFDDAYTAPRNGFADAADYYGKSSSAPLIPAIRLPGLVVHADDDPFIPSGMFLGIKFPPRLALEMIPSGGHLGYVSQSPWMGDHRWLEGRFASWLRDHWSLG